MGLLRLYILFLCLYIYIYNYIYIHICTSSNLDNLAIYIYTTFKDMSGKTLTIWGSLILSTYHMCVCELLNCRSEHVHCKIACYFRPQSWQGNGYVSNLPRRLVNAKLMDKISAQAFDVKTDLDHHPFQRNMHSFPPKPWFRLCMWFRIYIYVYIDII
jgi:hypothetical protein